MRKASFATLAVGLVTGAVAAPAAHAALFSPPLGNPGFEIDQSVDTGPGGTLYQYDFELIDWMRVSGSEAWDAITEGGQTVGTGPSLGTTVANLEDNGSTAGEIFEQVGTTDVPTVYSISLQAASNRNYTGAVTVKLVAGGTVTQTSTSAYDQTVDGYFLDYNTYSLTGGTTLGSFTTGPLLTSKVENLYSGVVTSLASLPAGEPLYLDISKDATGGGSQVSIDNVSISAVAVPEPASIGLLLAGAAGMFGRRFCRNGSRATPQE